jgi:putative ABC transport system permease protein
MKKEWSALSREEPFQYSFMDDRFNDTYKREEKTGTVLGIFAGLTIFVACLGLFGLTMYTTEQRTKEIGIRKVLGASVKSVTALLTKEFLKLVLLALVIALPVAGWVMNIWLQDFAYRINIPWWLFVSAAFLTVIIAMATISFQAIKAAIANPIKSLRAE